MRFRLRPTRGEESQLVDYCAQARFVWNLGLEQRNAHRPHGPRLGYNEQAQSLTEARVHSGWLRSGSVIVQQQALRDLDQAFRNWWGRTHNRPTWRVRDRHEGFRVVDDRIRWQRVSSRWGRVFVPKVGWVKFRWTRHPGDPKSYRVERDAAGRWWIAFAVIPEPTPAPGNGSVIGVDLGVTHAFTMSDGETVDAPSLSKPEKARLLRLQRKLARQQKGSARRERTKQQIAKVRHREVNRRKDTVEKLTTRLAAEHDLVRIEDLKIASTTRSARGTVEHPGTNVAQKRGLNRAILRSGWGLFAERLDDKAPGRVERVPAAYTSQRCHPCGHTCSENRESQAVFRCKSCGHRDNADVNAAKNIAAGHAVNGRGDLALARAVKRQLPDSCLERSPSVEAKSQSPRIGMSQ